MKRSDLKPGMIVAVRHISDRKTNRCPMKVMIVTLDEIERGMRGASVMLATRKQQIGVAYQSSREDGEANQWHPSVVLPATIEGPWAEVFAEYKRIEALRDKRRDEDIAKRKAEEARLAKLIEWFESEGLSSDDYSKHLSPFAFKDRISVSLDGLETLKKRMESLRASVALSAVGGLSEDESDALTESMRKR